jgi:large subunit ribosomal protein L15
MDLSNLKPAEGSTHKKQRLGRGEGSGRGGHSATRGTKGQNSRTGSHNRPVWFEGGQMPLYRRVPKFGFKSPFRVEPSIANVARIQRLIDEGRIDPSEPVTPQVLEDAGAIRSADLVKILGDGEINASITVEAHAFSTSAAEKIEDAGGTVTRLDS